MHMRVTYIVSQFPSVTETGILNLMTGLLDKGHDVRVVARNAMSGNCYHPDADTLIKAGRVNFLGMPKGIASRLARGAALACKRLPGSPREVLDSLNMFKFGVPALSLAQLFAGIALDPIDTDILHCQFGTNGLIGNYLMEKGMDAKFIVSFRGHDAGQYPRRAGRDVYRRMFEHADALTANTSFLRKKVADLGCASSKILVLPSGIRTDRFAFQPRKPDPGRPVRLISVGRLVEKKGHEHSIRAFASILGEFPDTEYQIVGDGPLRRRLESLVAELGLGAKVSFTGEVSQKRIDGFLSDAHIFVLACKTTGKRDFESQVQALQEAQASGLPVVSTVHDGIPEGVLDGVSAFLVPEGDERMLADRLVFLLRQPELWPEMGKAGRDYVKLRFDNSVVIDRLESIYDAMLAGGGPRLEALQKW